MTPGPGEALIFEMACLLVVVWGELWHVWGMWYSHTVDFCEPWGGGMTDSRVREMMANSPNNSTPTHGGDTTHSGSTLRNPPCFCGAQKSSPAAAQTSSGRCKSRPTQRIQRPVPIGMPWWVQYSTIHIVVMKRVICGVNLVSLTCSCVTGSLTMSKPNGSPIITVGPVGERGRVCHIGGRSVVVWRRGAWVVFGGRVYGGGYAPVRTSGAGCARARTAGVPTMKALV